MGQAKRRNNCGEDCQEKGRNYRGWKETALAAYESALGGTQKSGPKEVNLAQQGFSQPSAAAVIIYLTDRFMVLF